MRIHSIYKSNNLQRILQINPEHAHLHGKLPCSLAAKNNARNEMS